MDGTTHCGVDKQSTRHTSTPKGRFVLRADSIRPYSPMGKLLAFTQPLCSLSFGRILSAPTGRVQTGFACSASPGGSGHLRICTRFAASLPDGAAVASLKKLEKWA